ncbi:MAG: glycosyltransferase family 9 protein [Rhodospirillales bacterium]
MKVAVIQPLPGIGDTIWHLPHIRAIAAHVGGPVTLVTKPRSAADQIFGAETTVSDCLWIDRNPENRRGADEGLGALGFIARLKARQFDRIYLLHHSKTLAMYAWLAGIPERFGYGFGVQKLFLNRRPFLNPPDLRLHPFRQATLWLERAGIPLTEAEPVLPVAAKARQSVLDRIGPNPYVLIGIGSSEPYKQWGAEKFAALAAALLAAGWPRVVLVGGPAESALADAIATGLHGIVKAIGWNLGEVAALCCESAFYVGNDTGVMNIAAAVGRQTFGMFGATEPIAHSRRIVPIEPPGGYEKDGGTARITVEAVLETIRSARDSLGFRLGANHVAIDPFGH